MSDEAGDPNPLQDRQHQVAETFFANWVGIVLTLISIIQGLAFNYLAERFPGIYEYTRTSGRYDVLAHYVLCFAILVRVFQTYVVAAIAYRRWRISHYDMILIFVIGTFEYFAFSSLRFPNFDPRELHIRVAIIAVLACAGYLAATLRMKGDFASIEILAYRRELFLQVCNVIGSATVATLSLTLYSLPDRFAAISGQIALLESFIIAVNIWYSMRMTFEAPFQNSTQDLMNLTSDEATQSQGDGSVHIRDASRLDARNIAALIVKEFNYLYSVLFGANQQVSIEILYGILAARDGRHRWGVKKVRVSEVGNKGSFAGFWMRTERGRRSIEDVLAVVLSGLVLLRRLGPWGIVRFIERSGLLETASPAYGPDDLCLLYVCVVPEYRRRHVGAHLIEDAIEAARRMGKGRILVEVREQNLGAQRFFEKLGFTREIVMHTDANGLLGRGSRIRMVRVVPAHTD